ncbi:MAG: DUF5678 domain-containing protein [Blastocatellia bacterium]
MSQITFEHVLSQVELLLVEDKARLLDYLNSQIEKDRATESGAGKTMGPPGASLENGKPGGEASEAESLRARARAASLRDYSAENQWLREHRDEYAEQWVALKGNQLIHHSANAKEVFAAADAVGSLEVLVVRVEPRHEYKVINLG